MSAWSELPSLAAAARRALPEEDAAIDALAAEDRPRPMARRVIDAET